MQRYDGKQRYADLEITPVTLAGVPAGNNGQLAVVTDQPGTRLYVREGGTLKPVVDAGTPPITFEWQGMTGLDTLGAGATFSSCLMSGLSYANGYFFTYIDDATTDKHYIAHSTDLSTWTLVEISGAASLGLRSFIYDTRLSLYICCSPSEDSGVYGIYTSSELVTWTRRSSSYPIWQVLSDNTAQILAVGGASTGVPGRILRSTNGTSWSSVHASDESECPFYSIAWSGSLWVAPGGGNKEIRTSTNGTSWNVQTVTYGNTAKGYVFWDGAKFVVLAGLGSINTSTDGTTWTYHFLPWTANNTETFYAAVYQTSRGAWITLAPGLTPTLAYSTDGIAWNPLIQGIVSDGGSACGVVLNSDKIVARLQSFILAVEQ